MIAVVVGLAVVVGGCLLALKWYTTSGIRAGQGQLNNFGVPVAHASFAGETNDTGTDLCFEPDCTTVTRRFTLGSHVELSTVESAVAGRMRRLGYHVAKRWCSVADFENRSPPRWQFSCSLDGRRGRQDIVAVMTLSGVSLESYPHLGPPPYSAYGGLMSTDVTQPPGDPLVPTLDLDASG